MCKNKKVSIFDYKNSDGVLPCKHCLRKNNEVIYPKINVVDDLYYAQCPKCTHFDPYEFLSITTKGTLKNWNETMSCKEREY